VGFCEWPSPVPCGQFGFQDPSLLASDVPGVGWTSGFAAAQCGKALPFRLSYEDGGCASKEQEIERWKAQPQSLLRDAERQGLSALCCG